MAFLGLPPNRGSPKWEIDRLLDPLGLGGRGGGFGAECLAPDIPFHGILLGVPSQQPRKGLQTTFIHLHKSGCQTPQVP